MVEAYVECQQHPGVVYPGDGRCPVCLSLEGERCPVPDAPDAPSDSPTSSPNARNDLRSNSPPSSTGMPSDLISALQANTRAQLEMSRSILALVQSIGELIDYGTGADTEDDDTPGVGLDGQTIPRN